MQGDMKRFSRTLSIIRECVEKTNSHDNVIAEHEKQIQLEQRKKDDDFRELRILCSNFFTTDIITYLHTKSVELLKCNDFDCEEYITIFSDSSLIQMAHIDFLRKRLEEINDKEKWLNNSIKVDNEKSLNKVLQSIADGLLKGGANND